jgi:hypothetical protein
MAKKEIGDVAILRKMHQCKEKIKVDQLRFDKNQSTKLEKKLLELKKEYEELKMEYDREYRIKNVTDNQDPNKIHNEKGYEDM